VAVVVVVVGVGFLVTREEATTAAPEKGALLFDESFGGTSLNTNRWSPCYHWATDGCTNLSNDELEWYVPEQVKVTDGVLSLEADPAKCEAWRRNIADAGLEQWADLVEGDAHETLPAIDDVFDVVFLDAEKEDYEALFGLARGKLEPGALVIADNVLSHADALGAYSEARQRDSTLVSTTVPLDRGLELTTVLR